MKEIKLQSRDNIDNRLIHIEGNKYQLKTPYNYRVGFNKDFDDITFIDPAGGPFITIGTEIEGMKVKGLYSKGIVEFKDDLSCNSSE